MRNIFITGASGCVGHYVIEHLWQAGDSRRDQPYHLHILVRDRQKLRLPFVNAELISAFGNKLTVIDGDLLCIEDHASLLAQMDAVIHLAAAWGDAALSEAVNVTKTLELFNLLDPDRCQQILYFSTASLLHPLTNQPLAVAGRAGTDYIRSKYEMLIRRSEIRLQDRLITLYPTLLFGGSPYHPYSHITGGLKDVLRWLNVLRFLSLDAGFHFIHAEDIAQIVTYLLFRSDIPTDLVLGTPALTFDQSIEQVCNFYKKRIYFRIPVPIQLLQVIAFLLRVKLSEWDRYCIDNRHFVFEAVSAESFGLLSRFQTLEKVLAVYT